jgi:hypothetical protein
MDVAVANALEVCPEGNEGDAAPDFFVISGYVMKGLVRFIEYFIAAVIPAFTRVAATTTSAFRKRVSSCFIRPAVPIVAGIITTNQAFELEINRKTLSDGSFSGELNDLSIRISGFCEKRICVKNADSSKIFL